MNCLLLCHIEYYVQSTFKDGGLRVTCQADGRLSSRKPSPSLSSELEVLQSEELRILSDRIHYPGTLERMLKVAKYQRGA